MFLTSTKRIGTNARDLSLLAILKWRACSRLKLPLHFPPSAILNTHILTFPPHQGKWWLKNVIIRRFYMHKITEFLRESLNSQGKQTDWGQSDCTGNTTKMKTKKELWAKIFIRHFEVVCDWVSLELNRKMGLF